MFFDVVNRRGDAQRLLRVLLHDECEIRFVLHDECEITSLIGCIRKTLDMSCHISTKEEEGKKKT